MSTSGYLLPDYVWPAKAGTVFSYAHCLEMLEIVSKAIKAGITSGVQSYNVGSRGLTRYSLPDLLAIQEYYVGKANDALWGGSSMKVKRGVPCDA
jgi:hypothetical protein